MTKEETIKVLQSIEDRAIDFPHMTACDWVAIAAAKRHLQEEPVSKDLKHELVQWWNNHYTGIDKSYTFEKFVGHYIENSTLLDIARHFANWQKQLMMKNAVECDVIWKDDGLADLRWKDENGLKKLTSNLNNGDKVKIITVKEV